MISGRRAPTIGKGVAVGVGVLVGLDAVVGLGAAVGIGLSVGVLVGVIAGFWTGLHPANKPAAASLRNSRREVRGGQDVLLSKIISVISG
jgi:hypothetical protein